MNRRVARILTAALMALYSGCAHVAGAQTTVDDLLAKMPAQTTAEGDAVFAELVGLGADAIKRICAQLVPPGTGDDTNARYLMSGVVEHVTRPGAENERALVERALIEALAAAADNEVKAFIISQIQVAGGEPSVPPLSALLADGTLCEPATQALLAIGTPSATAAFEAALPSATDATRITIIQALGLVRSRTVVPQLLPCAGSDDLKTRCAALAALANIGDPVAGGALAKAAQAETPYERARGTSWYLLYARRLAEAGDKAQSEVICRDLLATRTKPEDAYAQSAALSTLAELIGDGVQPDLVAAMDSPNRGLRGTALKLAGQITGDAATAQWVAKLGQVTPETRGEILNMLADRGDVSAAPAALAALNDADKAVRLAAIDASARLAKADALQPLLAVLRAAGEDDEIAAARDALLRLPGESVMPAIAEAVPSVAPAARKALLEALASREATDYAEVVFAQTNDADSGVRVAAIKALERVAGPEAVPRIVALVLAAQDDAERSAARSVVVAIAKQVAEPEARIAPLVTALDGAPAEKGAHLLGMFPEIGGQPALDIVVAKASAADPAIKKAAVDALGSWPEMNALGPLLAVVKAEDDGAHQVTAMAGYVRLAGAAGKPPGETIKLYADALAAAKRPDEKKVVLSVLGGIHTLEALQLTGGLLDDEAMKADAAAAAVAIALPKDEKDAGLAGAEVIDILNKAIAATEDEALRKQASGHIASMPAAGEPQPAPDAEGFVFIFNGQDLTGWTGDTAGYAAENGAIVCKPGGNLYTEKEYANFHLKFEFLLTPGANNGLGIRVPSPAHAAYEGMELQILDDTAEKYKDIKPWQHHGSIYGIVPARQGHLKPVGEWNSQEVIANGRQITVILNGTAIVDANLDEATKDGNMDGKEHPGLKRDKGCLCFCGHGSHVEFRNLRIKELP